MVEVIVLVIGYVVYDICILGIGVSNVLMNVNILENFLYKIILDKNGDIVFLIDKKNGKELVKVGKVICLVFFI